jgi:arylsulfatase A-like enzyme
VSLPANFDAVPGDGQPPHLHQKHARYRDRGFGGFPLESEDDWRAMIARYWGLCSLVDTHVGTILRTLRQTGQDDRTLIVFTSDHGDQMGSHQLLAKAVMYKESTRVPLLLRLPGQARGGRVTGPVSQVDLAPTLLELMGVEPVSPVHGRSLAPLVREAADSDRPVAGGDRVSPCVIEWNPRADADDPQLAGAAMRTLVTPQGLRFTYSTDGHHELYDLSADPDERHNLAADPAEAPRLRELTAQLRQWQQQVADPLELTDPA